MWRRTSASWSGQDAAILRVNDLAERRNKRAPHNKTLRRVLVAPGSQIHAGPPCGAQFDIERRFEDLLEQLPLVNGGRRAGAQARAVGAPDNLGGEFRRQR